MHPSADGLTWTENMSLAPGRYQYKFVLNGEKWITDPNALRNVDDGSGNMNSEVVLLPPDYAIPAKIGDGIIAASALYHPTQEPYLNYDRGALTLTLRTRPNDIKSVQLSVDGLEPIDMTDIGGDELYERYSASFRWDRRHDVRYRFVLDDGRGGMVFGPRGMLPASPANRDTDSYTVKASTFHPFVVPAWAEHSVIYQIFPDRFADGDKSNDPPNVFAWDAKPTYDCFFGGDVAGVEQHLDYLKSLGISTVYFNPVFKSPANHRYETTDYLQIDPRFGTNAEFIKLTRDLKKAGIRTVLDGVFNHTSTSFPAFADVVKNGAASKYTNWYTFKSFPVRTTGEPNYVAWYNFGSMPKLSYSDPDVPKYILSVPEFWQSHADIAGWRLDVPNEVVSSFWPTFRKEVKGLDKDAWIVGEIWGDGSPWLQGDMFDSVMDYQFRQAVLGFVATGGNGKPSDLMRELMRIYNSYAPQVSRNLMNLIGSHDTPRILTLCGNDRTLAKLAAILQFTWVGAPSIYYGDELGMQGGADPDNRRGMTWQAATPDNDILSLYRKLIEIRKGNLPLQSGDPVPLLADNSARVVAFARILDGLPDVVAINRGDEPEDVRLDLRGVHGLDPAVYALKWVDVLGGRKVRSSDLSVQVRLEPRSAAILVPRVPVSTR